MTRNKIDANTRIFQRLIEYVEARGHTIPSREAPRWVASNPDANSVLVEARILRSIGFGRYRHLALIDFKEQQYIASIGFEHLIDDPSLIWLEDIRGFDVCLLSELSISPSSSAVEIFNIVAASNRIDDTDYTGHENPLIMSLFPPTNVYRCAVPITEVDIWSVFLSICAKESQHGGSWIEHELANSLDCLAELGIDSFPYRELCRSTLDLDPRSLFMSLYRCIEATYAHKRATSLKEALAIDHSWDHIAATLEKKMSWRPLEAESLNSVLSYAAEDDLTEICRCLSANPGDNPASAAGKAIYDLRNRIVHYRPSFDEFEVDSINWNETCRVLVSIARDVFNTAYGEETDAD